MRPLLAELLTEHTRPAVVLLPGRRCPGILIPGDTLKVMQMLARQVSDAAETDGRGPLAEDAAELAATLANLVAIYEVALDRHGLEPPYPRG